MNRLDCLEEVIKYKCVVLNLPTGYGKSKLAIDAITELCDKKHIKSILLVVAKTVHKNNWLDEIAKWNKDLDTSILTIECYNSLPKYENKSFDVVILDECHHLSDLKKEVLNTIQINETLLALSATISNDLKVWFKNQYNTFIFKNTLQEAITDGVLPSPSIYLIPLKFDKNKEEVIYKNKGKGPKVYDCTYKNRWEYIKRRVPVRIHCTMEQYYDDLSSQISYFKRRALGSKSFKFKWLKLCKDRLQYLSESKEPFIKSLQDMFKDERTLTFCNSISQTERLGKNCIHSKNINNQNIYNDFNALKINHITSCQMLNEGMNLTNCRIGIYANINASDTINKQKVGRLLRHKDPIIIIPYYVNTREEEIVNKIIEDYDTNLIKKVMNLNELKNENKSKHESNKV